jgi:hypothetical protein
VKRLVETSAGLVEIDFDRSRHAGLEARIATFDGEGWENGSAWWSTKLGASKEAPFEPLWRTIASVIEIPDDEAKELANAILEVWEKDWTARGGAADEHVGNQAVMVFLGLLAAIGVLALIGLAAMISVVVWFLLDHL